MAGVTSNFAWTGIMMNNPPNPDQLTVDDLRAYQAGRLTGSARHRVERLLLEQPFYADALAGLEALQQTGASLPAQTAQLRSALHRRVHESATKQQLWPLWLTTAISAIILVICITIYLIFFTKPVKLTRPLHNTKSIRRLSLSVVLPASDPVTEETRRTYDRLPGEVWNFRDRSIPMPLQRYDPSTTATPQAL